MTAHKRIGNVPPTLKFNFLFEIEISFFIWLLIFHFSWKLLSGSCNASNQAFFFFFLNSDVGWSGDEASSLKQASDESNKGVSRSLWQKFVKTFSCYNFLQEAIDNLNSIQYGGARYVKLERKLNWCRIVLHIQVFAPLFIVHIVQLNLATF